MKDVIINHQDYTTYQPKLLYGWTMNFEDISKDDICHTILEVVERINLGKIIDLKNYDSRSYDPLMMLTLTALAYAEHGQPSLRDMERYCRYDIRYRILSQNQQPSYKSFQRFMNSMKCSIEEVNKYVYLYIQDKKALEEAVLYVDGTKFEAYANKMTFFWSAWAKRHYPRNWKKCMELIGEINRYFKEEGINVKYSILKKPNLNYLIEIDEALDRWLTSIKAIRKGRGVHPIEKIRRALKKVSKKLFEYEIAMELLDGRNSFSKTDPDATFMHMNDYYNHTNVFKPGYNVQIGVNNGYIAHTYISGDANDVKTYIPFMESYRKRYGAYPKKAVGDAGYGSYDNYVYSELKGIRAILKYSGMEKKKEKVNDRNRYRSIHFEKDEKGRPICPQGHVFKAEKKKIVEGYVPKVTIHYRNEHCEGCPVREKCTKSAKGRTVQITPKLEKYHEGIDEYLRSEEGKRDTANRSIQAEGAFGDIKENFGYERIRRRGLESISMEIGFAVLGHNLRAYHNRKQKMDKKEKSFPQSVH